MREVWLSDGPVRLFAAADGEGPALVFLHRRQAAAFAAMDAVASRELRSIRVPTLLVRGDDAQHPAEVSDGYAASITDCTVLPATGTDTVRAVRDFCDAVIAA